MKIPFVSHRDQQLFRVGAPFIILLVGGSFGLKYFAQLRYTFRSKKVISKEEAEEMGIKMSVKKPSLETELEKMEKQTEAEKYVNVRGPRPGEDSRSIQNEIRAQYAADEAAAAASS